MSEQLKVNSLQVESNAATIVTAAGCFTAESLGSSDGKTSLTANGICKTAYNLAQSERAAIGAALGKDVTNIRSLNVEFEEFDKMMGKLATSKVNIASYNIGK